MNRTIQVDEEVYELLQSEAVAFEDTPNSVLRRLLELDRAALKADRDKTPQKAFRDPILRALNAFGGEARREQVLKEIEDVHLTGQLTEYDKANISSGTVRWKKSAEWEIRAMRMDGLLKPLAEAARGVWALTEKGMDAALKLPSKSLDSA